MKLIGNAPVILSRRRRISKTRTALADPSLLLRVPDGTQEF
jgi:hypothetical protein